MQRAPDTPAAGIRTERKSSRAASPLRLVDMLGNVLPNYSFLAARFAGRTYGA